MEIVPGEKLKKFKPVHVNIISEDLKHSIGGYREG